MPSDQRREWRRQFEQKILENEKVKRLGPREIPEIDSGSLPRSVALALRDSRKAAVMSSARRLMNYHNNLGALRRKKFRGEVISAGEKARIRKESEGMQDEFRAVLRNGARILREDQWLAAHAAAVGKAPEETDLWENLPDYFTDDELESISYLGINKDGLPAEWQRLYRGRQAPSLAVLNRKGIEQSLLELEQRADSITFPESAQGLESEGLLSIGGDEDAISAVVAVAAAVAVAVAVVLLAPIIAAILIVVVVVEVVIELVRSICNGDEIVRLHFKILTNPTRASVDEMLAGMQQVYATRSLQVQEISREHLNLPLLNDLPVGPGLVPTPAGFREFLSAEQKQLFANRNNVGNNDVVIYFVRTTTPPLFGQASLDHASAVVTAGASVWTLGHEVGHILGLVGHVDDTDRLMYITTARITNPPPDLTSSERETMCKSDYTVPPS